MSDIFTTAVAGTAAAGVRVSQAAEKIANLATNKADLASELVAIKVAEIELRANTAVIKAEAENEKQLVDILA